jgi:adenosylcobyric acid synthase
VLGICGGYQMLGRSVSDPQQVEDSGSIRGLDLLPIETEMNRDKVTVRSQGKSFLGVSMSGYEIHMGRTKVLTENAESFCIKPDGTRDGMVKGNVSGTYFHGLFENSALTEKFLTLIAESRQLDWRPTQVSYSRDGEYERLAAVMRENLDLTRIYDLLHLRN